MTEAEIRKRMKKNRKWKIRFQWFQLGQRRCPCCGVQLTWNSDNAHRSATVEHLVPASAGGTYHFQNTIVTCKGCNNARGAKNWIGFVRQNRFPKAEWLIGKYINAVEFYRRHNKVVYLREQKRVQQYLKKAA